MKKRLVYTVIYILSLVGVLICQNITLIDNNNNYYLSPGSCLDFMSSIENKVINIAQQACAIMKSCREKPSFEVQTKPDRSIVTEADLAIEKLLDEDLVKLLPGSIVIGEESVTRELIERAKKTKYVWIVDPIDGTTCFATPGKTEYGIGICLLEYGRPIFSLFHAPEMVIGSNKGCLFTASKSREGVYLNGERIVDRHTPVFSKENINVSLVGDTTPSPFENTLLEGMNHEDILDHGAHSTIARYCMVAASSMFKDLPVLFSHRSYKIWDVIQGAYFIEKLGGKVIHPDRSNVLPLKFGDIHINSANEPKIPPVLIYSKAVISSVEESLFNEKRLDAAGAALYQRSDCMARIGDRGILSSV